jgi:hypothetical protein
MYKALDVRDNTEVVILDQKWLHYINQLREFDRQDFLVCQGCRQPVRVRAGDQRREHFAHKHLENCDYSDESSILCNSRAVLYEWLVSKFGANVTIEKKIDGVDLFRPIDCWVQNGSDVLAYWIFDSRLKLEKREFLRECIRKLGIHITWVFALEMLHTEQDNPDKLILSTTEREFIKRSKYDEPFSKTDLTNGSLHYLDAENRKLLSFRGLSLYHEPQIYRGYNLTSNLDEVLVSNKNGEFVHNGEYEQLQEYRKLKKIDKFTYQRSGKFTLKTNSDSLKNSFKVDDGDENFTAMKDITETPTPSEMLLQNSVPAKNSGLCEICGKITTDFWYYDWGTGLCKCNSCKKQGKH